MDKEERQAWREEERQKVAELRERLAKEHGMVGHSKEAKLWDLAWEYGHAYGVHEVESYYFDFVELIDRGHDG